MLIPKIESRIEQYLSYLERNAYRKTEDLEFEVFEAAKEYRLPPQDGEWERISCPAPWGKEWTCFWFRTVFTVPVCENQERAFFLSVTPNADSLAFIDGKPAGAFNFRHKKLRIEADGKQHTLHIEAYSGHSHNGCGPFDGSSIFINIGNNIPSFPNSFEGGCILERFNTVYSLYYDVLALYETAKIAGGNSLRKAKILKGLSDALAKISFTALAEELEKQASEASILIAPLLALKNSPSVPAVHLIGHAHIDHAWLWTIAETKRKTARTFANMIRFISEYPEFIFLQSQPCQLEIIRNEYPDIFKSIREAFKNGNWEANGGMWTEADCNITGGESLIRQFLVGKKANKELLGDITVPSYEAAASYEADTLWLPDVFGYAAALPQIMKGCRIKYFVTSKINWNDTTRFPYDTFIWRGLDGTGIKTHFISVIETPSGYNGKAVPAELAAIWNAVLHKEVQSACIKPIGEGDGGGGTMRADLETARRLGDLEGCPRSAWKTVSAALDDIFYGENIFPEWKGELYLELHRGTYTTQAKTKKNNRMLETALRRAEFLFAFAAAEKKCEYPHKELLDIWKIVLTNQFHDIIPGSSIGEVYKEAEAQSAEILYKLKEINKKTVKLLTETSRQEKTADRSTGIFFFNDLGWERNTAVSFPLNGYVQTENDEILLIGPGEKTYPVQRYRDIENNDMAVCSVKIPPFGWVYYSLEHHGGCMPNFTWLNNVLESRYYKITFDKKGRIISLVFLKQNRELVAQGGYFNNFIIAEDVPVYWDAWDIDADWTKHIKQEIKFVSSEVTADGANIFRLRNVYKIGKSSRMTQDITCYNFSLRIDFETKIDWKESRRLLKAEFDTNINTDRVRCDVQFGHVWRNTHNNLMQDRAQFEFCAHKWISLEEENFGIALINNCKYGHDVQGGKMRLSLLRSPAAPSQDADRGEHTFTYSLLPFSGSFGNSGVIQAAYELNSPVSVNLHGGSYNGRQKHSLCAIEGNSVIIECIKVPEEGKNNELIIRMYESLGGFCRTALRFSKGILSAAETDMLEGNPKPLGVSELNENTLPLEFRAFEIKTVKVMLDR